jgi:hypothetical protein
MGEVHWVTGCVAMLEEDTIVLLTRAFVFLFNPASLVLGQKRSRVLVRIGKLADSIIVEVRCSVISLGRLKVLLRRLTGMVGKILSAPLINALLCICIKTIVGRPTVCLLIQRWKLGPLFVLDNITNVHVLLRAFLFLLWRQPRLVDRLSCLRLLRLFLFNAFAGDLNLGFDCVNLCLLLLLLNFALPLGCCLGILGSGTWLGSSCEGLGAFRGFWFLACSGLGSGRNLLERLNLLLLLTKLVLECLLLRKEVFYKLVQLR